MIASSQLLGCIDPVCCVPVPRSVPFLGSVAK